ncbi:MAG: polysaccharide biosynthesis tyrosine autokinase [Phycisphaeraceae bacterium]|nr:polysaccharide biosynthesis tyrosine autokinase [Phycisphaeraceae bacterium]
MSTVTPPRPSSSVPPIARPPAAMPQGAGSSAPTIDPIRLLKKYKWVIAAAVIVGVMVGVGGYLVLRTVMPRYESFAIFRVQGQPVDPFKPPTIREDELERYMLTQAQLMVSDTVLDRVAQMPNHAAVAPTWAPLIPREKGGVTDVKNTMIYLQENVKARIIPGTEFIRLSARAPKAGAAKEIVQLVRQTYSGYISEQNLAERRRQIATLQARYNENETLITTLKGRRDGELTRSGIDSIDNRLNEARNAIAGVNQQINQVRLDLEGVKTTLERYELNARKPGGPTYDDSLRATVEAGPIISNYKMRISALETELRKCEAEGMGPGHTEYRRIVTELNVVRDQMNTRRDDELRQAFFGQLQNARNAIEQLQRQEADLSKRKNELAEGLNRVLAIQIRIGDIDRQIQGLEQTNQTLRVELDHLRAIIERFLRERGLPGGKDLFEDRVALVQSENVPDTMAFPRLTMLLPLGVVLVCGLVGSLIVVREIVDQRVKGPGDVAILPRTRVLGMIPIADNDPAGRTAVETAFRDRPTGMVAEHFRQVRAPLIKRMEQAGHKTLVVAAGMPDSGATSTVLNLAFASAAAGQRVLVIDANMRRPALHRLLERSESPGLADVLAGQMTFEQAVQTTGVSNLSLLSAGTKEQRIYERLGTEDMGRVLANAKAHYDLVLVDVPPMVVSGDALSVATRADASMLVVRALSEKRGLVARLRTSLGDSHSEFLGILVNGVRPAAGGYLRKNIRVTHEYQANSN